MNESAGLYIASGSMIALVTLAFFMGHTTSAVHIAVVGSQIGTIILTQMFKTFK